MVARSVCEAIAPKVDSSSVASPAGSNHDQGQSPAPGMSPKATVNTRKAAYTPTLVITTNNTAAGAGMNL